MCTVVAIAFKMSEQAEQWICIKFCLKLERSSTETIQMLQKATGVGNWWLAASSQKCTHSCIMSHAEFFGETWITQVIQPRYSPDLVPCEFWLFPKLKSPLKGKRSQNFNEIQKNTAGQLTVTARTVWGPKVPMLKGTEESLPYVQCVLCLVPCIFFNNSLFFIIHG